MQYSGTVHLPVTVPMMRYTDVSETLPRYGAVTTCHDTGMHAKAAMIHTCGGYMRHQPIRMR